ncbi:hypothetical protein IAT38_001133 [Cryptococcus sp. DSM 104549]
MALPPLHPTKTAAGIIVDPQTLERVVPQSRRKDGTVRKEQKVRPGFTPQEDIGLFRSARRAAREGSAPSRPVVPGSGRTAEPPRSAHSFDQDTGIRTKAPAPAPAPAPEPASESGLGPSTTEARKEKRAERVEKVGVSWDEMGDDDGEDLGAAFGKLDLENKVAGREDVGTEDGFPPLQGGGVPREGIVRKSRKPDGGANVPFSSTAAPGPAKPTDSVPSRTPPTPSSSRGPAPTPSLIADRQAEVARSQPGSPLSQPRSRLPSSGQSPGSGKWYPIQGQRRQGPCGLANPEAYYERQRQEQEAKQRQRGPPPPPSASDAAGSWRSARRPPPSQPQSQPTPRTQPPSGPSSQPSSQPPPRPNAWGAPRPQNQPPRPPASSSGPPSGQDAVRPPRQTGSRERKGVRVRQDGANGRGSLADRVRGLVVANENGNGKGRDAKKGPEVKKGGEAEKAEKVEEEDTGGW